MLVTAFLYIFNVFRILQSLSEQFGYARNALYQLTAKESTMSALTEKIERLRNEATALAADINLLLRQHDQLEGDTETLLSLKLFRSLDPQFIAAIAQALQVWKSFLFGRIVAIRNEMCPTEWMVGICEGVDMHTSGGSWLMLKARNDELIIIDTSNKGHTVSRTCITEYPCRFGFIVYLNEEGCMNPALSDGIGDTHYRMLAKQNRLFCIAAHLLNAAEQVPSELMERAIADALQARTNLQKLESDLLSLQGILKLYENRPSINPEDARAEQSRKDILRVTKGIEHLRTVYPEIPLLGPEKLDDDPDSDVTLCMVGPDREDIIAMEDENPLPDHL